MRRLFKLSLFLIWLVSSSVSYATPIKIAAGKSYTLYYSTAASLCTVLQKESKKECEVVITDNSIENRDLLTSDKVNYALIHKELISKDLIQIKKLYTEHLYILYKGPKKESLAEISKYPYLLNKNSNVFHLLKDLFKSLDVSFSPLDSLSTEDRFNKFCYGDSQVFFYTTGHPSDFIDNAILECGNINIYSLSPEELSQLNNFHSTSEILYQNNKIHTKTTDIYLVAKKDEHNISNILDKYSIFLQKMNKHIAK